MAQRHIVLIPGYYGSNLRDHVSNTLFWLSFFTIQKPEHTLEGIRLPNSAGRVFADGIVDNFNILLKIPIYHGLISFLVHGMGYARNEVNALGVDWRQSLNDLVGVLKDAVDAEFEASGQKVDIIAHSHGGLVARKYLDQIGGDRVEKLITLGTPHNGMLETMEALCQGVPLLRFDSKALMDVARGFPSAYELLPVNSGDGYFTWNDVMTTPLAVTEWCATTDMVTMVQNAAKVVPLNTNIPVPLFAIHGTRTPTIAAATGPTIPVPTGPPDGMNRVAFDVNDAGDGTVPLQSGAARGITATGGVQRFAVPFAGHAFVFDNRNTQEVIRHILRGDPQPQAYFTAEWENEIYLPNSTNRVVAVLDDFGGDPIPDATVTVTLPGFGITDQPLTFDPALGDYFLDVNMPGPGTASSYMVRATAPTLQQALEVDGSLHAASN
jgi:pimeloyl-ACP methyl ester carboxylesterase